LESASQYNDAILETVREPLVVLDASMRVRKASRSFYDTFHMSRRKTEGQLLHELGGGEWNVSELRERFDEVLTKNRRVENFRVKQGLSKLTLRTWVLSARRLESKGERLVLVALEDTTAGPRPAPSAEPQVDEDHASPT
jgi:nitrogen-specific signal transduction histidine kinase